MLKIITATLGMIGLSASIVLADNATNNATNKALVLHMMSDVFIARDASAVDDYFAVDLIQRNPMIRPARHR